MVAAVTALWLVTGAVRATIGHAVDVTGEPLPGVDTLRIVTGINYALLGLSGMTVLALSMLAFSILLLRTRAMRPWVGRVGLLCSVPMLAAVAAQYGASPRSSGCCGRSASRSQSGGTARTRREPSTDRESLVLQGHGTRAGQTKGSSSRSAPAVDKAPTTIVRRCAAYVRTCAIIPP